MSVSEEDQSFPASVQLTAQIQLPPILERNIDKLFLLGEIAGPGCLHLVRLIAQYSTVQSIVSAAIMMDVPKRRGALRLIGEHLSFIDQVVAKCEHEVRPID